MLSGEQHTAVGATWGVYQGILAAYRHPDRKQGRADLTAVMQSPRSALPSGLDELRTLGRTLTRRAGDVLAHFDRPGTSNGHTEAISGRLEHLRGTALGFRNFTHYITQALLDAGGLRPATPPTAMSPSRPGATRSPG